jgi:hypothetical protein
MSAYTEVSSPAMSLHEAGAGEGATAAPVSDAAPAVVSSSSVGADTVTVAPEAPATAHNPDIPGGQRCACGCVPNIMSMFEMAALRAKRRGELKAAKEAEEALGAQEAEEGKEEAPVAL